MKHKVHNIGVAQQIARYSDAIETTSHLRWLRGKTIIRHPNKENQWLKCTLLNSVVEGRLVASVSGHDQCEIFSVPPIGKPAPLESPKQLDLFITFRGRNCFRR